MDSLLNRYRDLTVLVLVILAQLVLLAYQVRSDKDVRLIRVWAVTAVTPVARGIEAVRSTVVDFFGNYFSLRDVRQQNRAMRAELDRLKMENQFFKTELATADRARELSAFQARTQSRTLAARVIATGAGTGSKVVYVDRGSLAGVEKGMAVVTPDGIVGKVIASFPTASEVLLVTDSSFAAGVISQKNRVRGTLKGQGYDTCRVDYVQNEENVESGEWFYTSGDDRVFPKGMPVGQAKIARPGSPFKDILVDPSGLQNGLEEVLVVLEGVHQQIPENAVPSSAVYLGPPPPPEQSAGPAAVTGPGTEADRLHQRYRALGEAQNHVFGEGLPGSKPPDFNAPLPAPGQAATPPVARATPPKPQDAAPATPPAARATPPKPQAATPATPPADKATPPKPLAAAPTGEPDRPDVRR